MTFLDMTTLETERLILRKITKRDADDMYEYSKIPEVSKYLTWEPHDSVRYTRAYIKFLVKKYREGEYYDWAIELKNTHKFIGTCGYSVFDQINRKAEIGYVLNPLFWGQGYATEAVLKIIQYAFNELDIHRIEARLMDGNIASECVVKKCGLKYEGTGKDEIFIKGEYRTLHHYSLLKN